MFTATPFATVDDKKLFVTRFKHFVLNGFKLNDFRQDFYQRLSNCFGFIAHYDRMGFFREYFVEDHDKAIFIRQCLTHPCYGEARHTFSDVEKELQKWLKSNKILEDVLRIYLYNAENKEKQEYERLKAKYG